MKVVLQQGAHDAVGGAGEGFEEAGLHLVEVRNGFPSCSLVRVHSYRQLNVGVVEEERIVGLHDVAVDSELVNSFHVVGVSC